jgi:hypothetical protein
MDFRQRQDLDRYITGDYGEAQFRHFEESEVAYDSSVHEEFRFEKQGYSGPYDAADDGPEVNIIRKVCPNIYDFTLLWYEQGTLMHYICLDAAVKIRFGPRVEFLDLSNSHQYDIMERVDLAMDSLKGRGLIS